MASSSLRRSSSAKWEANQTAFGLHVSEAVSNEPLVSNAPLRRESDHRGLRPPLQPLSFANRLKRFETRGHQNHSKVTQNSHIKPGITIQRHIKTLILPFPRWFANGLKRRGTGCHVSIRLYVCLHPAAPNVTLLGTLGLQTV